MLTDEFLWSGSRSVLLFKSMAPYTEAPGAVPLAVAWQRGVCGNGLMLWALVDLDEQTTVKRRFVIAPTGQPLPDEAAHWPYVGRVELPTDPRDGRLCDSVGGSWGSN